MLAFLLQTRLLAGYGCVTRNMWLSALATPVDVLPRQAHRHRGKRLSQAEPGSQGCLCPCRTVSCLSQSWELTVIKACSREDGVTLLCVGIGRRRRAHSPLACDIIGCYPRSPIRSSQACPPCRLRLLWSGFGLMVALCPPRFWPLPFLSPLCAETLASSCGFSRFSLQLVRANSCPIR